MQEKACYSDVLGVIKKCGAIVGLEAMQATRMKKN
jgi:hypothetical protein